MILNMESGAAAYMISGGIAGGLTALDVAVGLATILNIVFAIIDIVAIVGALFAALYYFELVQTEYAAHILLDAVINIATLGLFKLIKKFAPATGTF